MRPLVTLLPGDQPGRTDSSGALAVVRYGGQVHQTPQLSRLLQAVPTRRTNRLPFLEAPVPLAHRAQLVRAVESERGWLHLVSDREQRARLRQLVVQAHHEQMADPRFVAELAAWTGRNGVALDGVPVTAGGPRPGPQDEWVLRDFTAGRGRSRVEGKDFESDPFVVVLCSFYEGPLAELQAGQALQRMLLTATILGLSASFLSQPIEVPHIRTELRRALGTTMSPQAVLRIELDHPFPAPQDGPWPTCSCPNPAHDRDLLPC